MCKQRKSWRDKIDLILTGVTDYDDWSEIMVKCATLADLRPGDEFGVFLSFQKMIFDWDRSMLALATGKASNTDYAILAGMILAAEWADKMEKWLLENDEDETDEDKSAAILADQAV